MNHRNELPDFDWLAIQYVLRELDSDRVEEFELQLDRCQEAREAVVRAVEVIDTVAICEEEGEANLERPSRPQTTWTVQIGWSLIGAAACLAVFGGQYWISRQDADRPGTAFDLLLETEATASATQLAHAWSAVREVGLADGSEIDLATDAETEDFALPEIAPDADVNVPGWMLIALENMQNSESVSKEATRN